MKISILDDYQDTLRTLAWFGKRQAGVGNSLRGKTLGIFG